MASIISTKTSGGGGIAVTGDTSGIMQLASNNGTTAVTIDASQNVGIGTSSPASSLDVQAVDGRSIIRLTATTNTNPVYSRASNAGGYLYLGRDGSAGADFGAGAYAAGIWSTGAYPMVFGTNGTERMRIDSSGNVLVGTTSTLGASGSGLIQSVTTGGVSNLWLRRGTDYGGVAQFQNFGGSTVGSISVAASTTAYNTSSDYRLKENIAPMTGALNTIAQLKPVTYTWKADGSDGQGFIAHELQEIVPDCVTGEKDAVDAEGNPQYQGIDTSFLVATLTAAIQEQQAIITDLKARIEVLEGAQA